MADVQPHLISFEVGPFVQRSRTILNSKSVEVDVSYIDLDQKPDWFLARVPTGKVPALFVGERTLFESSAINEYFNEVTPGDALGDTPIDRAEARAWISLSDETIMSQYRMLMSGDAATYASAFEALAASLTQFASIAGVRAAALDISLLDAAIAPVFARNAEVPVVRDSLTERLPPALLDWSDRLLGCPEVEASVTTRFSAEFRKYFAQRGSFVIGDEAQRAV